MSRGKRANNSRLMGMVDNRYQSDDVARLIRMLMKDGKASIARKIVYKAMSDAASNMPKNIELPEHNGQLEKELLVLRRVLEIIHPRVEVKSRRVGGANYQVPQVVSRERGNTLARRWLVTSAKSRSEGKPMWHKLAQEMKQTLEGRSGALSKKETQDKMASANRANANLARRDSSSKSDSVDKEKGAV